MKRRVVVTGIGVVCPLGSGISCSWDALINGKSGVRAISSFDASSISSRIAGEVPNGTCDGEFDISSYIEHKEQKKIDRFIALSIAASEQAFDNSGIRNNFQDPERFGVIIGSGIGGLPEIEKTAAMLHADGTKKISPFFIPSSLINLAAGDASIRFGLKGPGYSVVSACASGAHAIGEAFRLIQHGYADAMLAGGTEAAICKMGVGGFAAMRALSTKFNDRPEEASRPWDKERDGFVISEGAATLVLEEMEIAKRRGAKIYGEITGYGMSMDAHHITSPCEDGDGAYRSMRAALSDACINPDEVDYISAHGTSTPAGDKAELVATERLFKHEIYMSSVKSAIGHTLGAAGAIEAAFALLSMKHGIMPPTLNLHDSEETRINLVPLIPVEKRLDCILSNSFGFGGMNVSLVFNKI